MQGPLCRLSLPHSPSIPDETSKHQVVLADTDVCVVLLSGVKSPLLTRLHLVLGDSDPGKYPSRILILFTRKDVPSSPRGASGSSPYYNSRAAGILEVVTEDPHLDMSQQGGLDASTPYMFINKVWVARAHRRSRVGTSLFAGALNAFKVGDNPMSAAYVHFPLAWREGARYGACRAWAEAVCAAHHAPVRYQEV
eukprot:gnl/Dysnectes_brevis/3466_a4394_762.p2 GENE.gnl/Dysnectes_brevis/3466_a4394_762~~gnl/Dysnectes_brevis/3466_a4394_762.p2  ORF type:complete len:195 (+),score=38.45 gnl/Dysnectes_brevis/3466_a4394_762:1276-1860(+)